MKTTHWNLLRAMVSLEDYHPFPAPHQRHPRCSAFSSEASPSEVQSRAYPSTQVPAPLSIKLRLLFTFGSSLTGLFASQPASWALCASFCTLHCLDIGWLTSRKERGVGQIDMGSKRRTVGLCTASQMGRVCVGRCPCRLGHTALRPLLICSPHCCLPCSVQGTQFDTQFLETRVP